MKNSFFAVFSLFFMFFLASCASTPSKPLDTDKGRSFVAQSSLQDTYNAAKSALAEFNFALEKDTPNYLQGSRARQVGLLVGSGGETAGIWLEAQGDKQTHVLVDSAETFVGYAGQKDWSEEIINSIKRNLDETK